MSALSTERSEKPEDISMAMPCLCTSSSRWGDAIHDNVTSYCPSD